MLTSLRSDDRDITILFGEKEPKAGDADLKQKKPCIWVYKKHISSTKKLLFLFVVLPLPLAGKHAARFGQAILVRVVQQPMKLPASPYIPNN